MQGQPVAADLYVSLYNSEAERVLFDGENDSAVFATDYSGNGIITLPLQNLGHGQNFNLRITVDSALGTEVFYRAISLVQPEEGQNLIIHFDKGLYKPGDDVLFRILAVNRDARPLAGGHYTISIFDGNDNRVFVEEAQASDFGIMSGRFRLADEVNSGFYRLTVERGGSLQAQTFFEVSPYVLPQFEINLETDHAQYNVGDTIYLTGYARYFFDEPVNQGTVSISINGQPVMIEEPLGENGEFSLSYTTQTARVYSIFVEVIDNSNFRVEETLNIRVAEGLFEIDIMPEHGFLVRDMPNRVYVFTTRADGSPLKTNIQVTGRTFSRQVVTDDNGIGVFYVDDAISWNHIYLRAMDMDGNIVSRNFTVDGEIRNVTLSTDRPRYSMGETIQLSLNSREEGGYFMIYVYRNDRLLKMLTSDDGQPAFNLGDAYGLIDIFAVWVGPYNGMGYAHPRHAHKTIFIDPGRQMNLSVQSDKPEYRPGEFASLSIGVMDNAGNPLDAALFVNIVDEAMLSLAANDLSIDNIRLALQDIRIGSGLDAATLYASLIAGASEQAITRILLRQRRTSLSINTTTLVNPEHYYWGGSGSGMGEFLYTINIMFWLLVTTIIFVSLRHKVKRPLKPLPRQVNNTGYMSNPLAGAHIKYPGSAGSLSNSPSDAAASPSSDTSSIYPDFPGYLPNTPPKPPSKTGERVASWVVVGAIILFVFALIFLASCSRDGSDMSMDNLHEAPPPSQFEPAPIEVADDAAWEPEADFDAMPGGDLGGRPAEEIETQTARVRRLFLETLLFVPELIARDGHGELSFMMADNITTWNIQVVGNTQDGLVGHTESSIRAFQPFFVNFELPRNSIRYDQISIPVTVFNYTEAEQVVILTIAELDWFTLLTDPIQTMTVPPNQSRMIYVPIRIVEFGDFVFRVYADTHGFADAVERSLRVNPEGFRMERVVSSGTIESSLRQPLIFMEQDIPDTRRATVKFYPSVMAQVVEGMENIFRMPFGCFEQTSSILFPNILALRYMQANNIDNPQLTSRALEFISSGYQRLLTFEVSGTPGGFSLFGHAPAETVLTAYGLMQLQNLTSVYTIDERVLDRMANFLFSHQNSDGSFEITGPRMYRISSGDTLAFNAYIIWAISEAFPTDLRLTASVSYLENRLHEVYDNYTLALIANVLVNTRSPLAGEAISRLNGNVSRDGDMAYLATNSRDYFGTRGLAQDLQTSALTSLAFSRNGTNVDTNTRLINFVIANRDSWGTWSSTQATILSLMALTNYASASPLQDGQITVTIGNQQQVIEIRSDNTLDFYMVSFTGLERENVIDIHFPNLGQMTYKISLEFFAPYDSVELDRGFELSSNMRTQLAVHEWVDQELRVVNTSGFLISNAVVAVSIPQGMRVEASSLGALRHRGLVERYETRFDTINLYLRDIEPWEVLEFVIAYRPSYPVVITGGHVRVFDYYNPTVEGFLMPVNITVE